MLSRLEPLDVPLPVEPVPELPWLELPEVDPLLEAPLLEPPSLGLPSFGWIVVPSRLEPLDVPLPIEPVPELPRLEP